MINTATLITLVLGLAAANVGTAAVISTLLGNRITDLIHRFDVFEARIDTTLHEHGDKIDALTVRTAQYGEKIDALGVQVTGLGEEIRRHERDASHG